ncbi:hypothetical protein LV84_02849 [Algoriphagus ratkowskyi]|uniref:Uncharacterized protein n=1 Tax=Algoriphagus ratkowskyi TaxID=57028 RepID=A0A2W7R6B6_9BACT|nr:hypothetical protein LV84_02849 [Algoriphagus ratkowskyi]
MILAEVFSSKDHFNRGVDELAYMYFRDCFNNRLSAIYYIVTLEFRLLCSQVQPQ